ncbi:MAG: L-threonylcarbamoyladenylate synthase [Parasphingopyxis sp.]|nr:threonylcarbamoyl-AMP synthase [Sphingomonadales bacterium]
MAVDTVTLPADEAAIAEAARRIGAGECVAVPTETVYGLAADATNGEAVARIYEAKARPGFNPLIVHVPDIETAKRIAGFKSETDRLAQRYWPGPLTLVLPHRDDSGIASLVTAGLNTIALRVPAHPVMRALLEAAGVPLAAPSANASGRISPTRADHVAASLGGKIGLILDGGASEGGIESTIISHDLRLLRPGPITPSRIKQETGLTITQAQGGAVEAPGQLASHYAPAKPLRLEAMAAEASEWLIGFGPVEGDASLSRSGDLVEAAANLFARLHEAEASDRPRIAVAPVPDTGLGAAINDRLRRAAAPR